MVNPRVLPGVVFGAFAGTGLVTLPPAAGLLLFGMPLLLCAGLRAMLWRSHPQTRPATAGLVLGAATPIVATVLIVLPLPRGEDLAGIVW
jgi:hypothetical protein